MIVLSSSPIWSNAVRRRPKLSSIEVTMAAYTSMYRANSACSSELNESHGATSWPGSALRGGSSIDSSTNPSAFIRANRSSRSTSQPAS